ncbi:MAG: hypothetical protein ACYDGR_10955 [Candidatus Dormibacteria bacterium]
MNPLRTACRVSAIAVMVGVGTVAGVSPTGVTTSRAAAPTATFTPNVRADAAEGTGTGQNEPQVTVDYHGTTYVTWQGDPNATTGFSSTTDGINFTNLGTPDPTQVNDLGDVALATTTWPYPDSRNLHLRTLGPRDNGVFWSDLGTTTNPPGAIEIRSGTTADGGKTWAESDAPFNPTQTDRNWLTAYTPLEFRRSDNAIDHTDVYQTYHDFGVSNIWVIHSPDGGKSWDPTEYPAIEPGSTASQTSANNSIPGGVAVDRTGAHPGRVFVVWSTSDVANNLTQGGNITQGEPFDHIFLSYSDQKGAVGSWHSTTVFNDPCAPNPPVAPPSVGSNCQDVSELFTPLAVDDAGNVYVSFTWRDASRAHPEYDEYVAKSTDGGQTFGTPFRVTTDVGTHYMPWIAAGANGAVDVVYYATTYVAGVGTNNKPGAVPGSGIWNVFMSQTLDGGQTWTQSKVSDHPNYFGDICSVGIFCSQAGPALGWGPDRILLDDFGVAIGPDGGARVAWTDTHDSWKGTCQPGGSDDSNVPCQSDHLYFACQSGGMGLEGQPISGCGQVAAATVAATPAAVATPVPAAVQPPLPNTSAPGTPPAGLLAALAALGLLAASRCKKGFAKRGR